MPEERIGRVTEYFAKIGVAGIQLTDGSLRVGDTIHIKGHTTDFQQVVDSIQVEHQDVQEAGPGTLIGVKVRDRVREHDIVYKVVG